MVNIRFSALKGVNDILLAIFFSSIIILTAGCSGKSDKKNVTDAAEASRLKENGRYDSSISIYKTLLENTDSTADCEIRTKYLIELSDLNRLLGKFDQAEAYLEKIDTLNCTDEKFKLDYLLTAGKIDYDKRNYTTALGLFSAGLRLSEHLYGRNSTQTAECFNMIGKCGLSLNNYADAEKYLNLSLTVKKDSLKLPESSVVSDYISIGLYQLAVGQYDKSLKNFNNALASIPDSANNFPRTNSGELLLYKASALNARGIVYYQLSEFDEALKNLNDALKIREKILTASHYLTADIYGNLGMIYVSYAEPEIAKDLYERALNTRLQVFGENSTTVARTYNNLGNVFKDMGEYDKSETYFRKALNTLGMSSSDNLDYGITLGNLGDAEARNKNFKGSIEHFTESIKILKKYFGEEHPWTAITIDNLGLAYAGMGNYDEALKYHTLAYKIARKVYPGKSNPLFSQLLDEMGHVYEIHGDYRAAIKLYQRSVSNLFSSVSAGNYFTNPPEAELKRDVVALETLGSKANILYELYRQTKKKQFLEVSLNTYDLVDKTIDMIRAGFKEESSRLFLSEKTHRIFYNAIRTFADAYERKIKMQGVTAEEQAFSFCEKSKALSLLQSLINIREKDFGGIPDSLLQREHKLQYRISIVETKLLEARVKGNIDGESQVSVLQNSLFDLKKQYYALIENFEKNYPRYYSLKYKLKPVSVDSLREKLLKDNDVLVEYFLGEDRLFIFLISKNNFVLRSITLHDSIPGLVADFRKGLNSSDYRKYAETSYKLYTILLRPFEDIIRGKNLIVVPDGVLNYIPFDALITMPPDLKQSDYKKLRYVIYDYRISYGYSASLLWENIIRDKPLEPNSFVGFAPF